MNTIPHNKKWTKEACIKDASKYLSKTEWINNSKSAYMAAHKFKWLKECTTHMKRPKSHLRIWTIEKCEEESKKFETSVEWIKESPSSYVAAQRHGILESCTSHMDNLRIDHSFELCKEDASKYLCISDWDKNSNKIYSAACRHGWMPECTVHMGIEHGSSSTEKFIFNFVKSIRPSSKKLRDRKVKIEGKPHIHGFDIDIYIPELNRGIEFDGTYWHSEKSLKRGRPNWSDEDIKNYHQIKDSYFLSKGIELLHIKEKDWILDKGACIQKCLKFLSP